MTSAMVAGFSDIIGFIIKPVGPYFPGWTLNAVLTGLIHGFFLYNKPVSLKRIILSNIIVVLFVNLLLGTYWIQVMGYSPFFVALPARALESLIMLPFEVLVIYSALKLTVKFKQRKIV